VEARLSRCWVRSFVTDLLDTVRGAWANYRRYLPYVLLAAYLFRAFTQAPTMGQLFATLVIGIASGCVYAIAASGLVLTYATTGVFNFAHGAVGMMSAYLYWALIQQHNLPVPLALFVILFLFAPLVGIATERVMRYFNDAPVQTTVTVTIAVTVMLIGLAQKMFPPDSGFRLDPLLGLKTLHIWEARPSYDNILALVLAVGVAILLRGLLFVSRTGVAMRAVVDNPTLAALNGAPPNTIARYSWILGSVLAALAGVLLASQTGSATQIELTFFILAAYGAAVIGKLKSLPLTFAGAIALGILKEQAFFILPKGNFWSSMQIALPGVFLFLSVLLVPAARLSVGRVVGVKAPRVPNLRDSLIRGSVFLGAMVVLSRVAPAGNLTDMTRALIYGVLLLSLVLLTGFSGQISLCQYVFVGIGAWAMGYYFGGHSIFGMLLAGLIAVPFGAFVALPAIRLQGLYLALVTLGFAAMSQDLVLSHSFLYGGGDVRVGRLKLLGVSFQSDEAFFVLCAIVFTMMAIAILVLKRGPLGRRLAALRDSQAACATLGLDVRRTKLTVFSMSAFIAGLAGALFGGLNAFNSVVQFDRINNIVLLLFAVVGGITTVTGAFIGGSLFALLPYVQSEYPDQAGLVFAAVAVAVVALGRQPNGLAGMLFEAISGRGKAGREKPDDSTSAKELARASA
jgi:branched-chain amino acid transport system permease protein